MFQDPNYFTLILAGTFLLFLISLFIILLYMLFSKRLVQNELNVEKLRLNHQKELLSNEIKAAERERERIAKDLHDEIGPVLSIISINMSKEAESNANDTDIEKNKVMLDEAILNIRRITHSLLPPSLEMLGLIPTLIDMTQNMQGNFEIDIQSNNDLQRLPKETSLQLYRVVMELINNSIKHSGGDTICLNCNDTGSSVSIEYSDNGKGFDFESHSHHSGLGLKNIESRLSAIHADFSFGNNNGGGSLVQILINT